MSFAACVACADSHRVEPIDAARADAARADVAPDASPEDAAALVPGELLPVDARACAQLALVPDGERMALVCATGNEVVAWGSFEPLGTTPEDADWRDARRVLLTGLHRTPFLSVRDVGDGRPVLFIGGMKDSEVVLYAWRPGDAAVELASPSISYRIRFDEERVFPTGLSGAGPRGHAQVFGPFTEQDRHPGLFLVDVEFLEQRFAEGGTCRDECVPWLRDEEGTILRYFSPIVERDTASSLQVVVRDFGRFVERLRCTRDLPRGATCSVEESVEMRLAPYRPVLARCDGGFLAGAHIGPGASLYVPLDEELAQFDDILFSRGRHHGPPMARQLHAGRSHCAMEYLETADGHPSLLTYSGSVPALVEDTAILSDVDAADARRLHTNDGLGIAVTSPAGVRLHVL